MRIVLTAVFCIAPGIAALGVMRERPAAAPAAVHRVARGQGDTTRTVWDSIFTDDQAKRGQVLYMSNCSSCHGPQLTGNDDATPLAGDSFLSSWNGLTLADLFAKIQNAMPPDTPGLLDGPQTVDVITYVLSYNNFPSGFNELAPDPGGLKMVMIQAAKKQ